MTYAHIQHMVNVIKNMGLMYILKGYTKIE